MIPYYHHHHSADTQFMLYCHVPSHWSALPVCRKPACFNSPITGVRSGAISSYSNLFTLIQLNLRWKSLTYNFWPLAAIKLQKIEEYYLSSQNQHMNIIYFLKLSCIKGTLLEIHICVLIWSKEVFFFMWKIPFTSNSKSPWGCLPGPCSCDQRPGRVTQTKSPGPA